MTRLAVANHALGREVGTGEGEPGATSPRSTSCMAPTPASVAYRERRCTRTQGVPTSGFPKIALKKSPDTQSTPSPPGL